MNCESVTRAVPLYHYGELAAEMEEQVEEHLAKCAACAEEMKRYGAVAAALDGAEGEMPSGLLAQCRRDLLGAIEQPAPASRGSLGGLGRALAMFMGSTVGLKLPAGALALIAIGYFGARFTPSFQAGDLKDASLGAEPVISAVRSVQAAPGGRIQIAVDEIRRRTISGRADDEKIRRLLLAGLRDETNAGVRVESLDVLKDRAGSAEIHQALLDAAAHDRNAGVRLRAIEGLKAFAASDATRKTLAHVLLNDDNPGVRIEAIDLLTSHRDDSIVGLLQNVVQKEENSYVRMKCQTALEDMHASVGTF